MQAVYEELAAGIAVGTGEPENLHNHMQGVLTWSLKRLAQVDDRRGFLTKMFFDAACVLAGEPETTARLIWRYMYNKEYGVAGDDYNIARWLNRLQERCLLRVEDGKIWVHDILIALSRSYACVNQELVGRRAWSNSSLATEHYGRVQVLRAGGPLNDCSLGAMSNLAILLDTETELGDINANHVANMLWLRCIINGRAGIDNLCQLTNLVTLELTSSVCHPWGNAVAASAEKDLMAQADDDSTNEDAQPIATLPSAITQLSQLHVLKLACSSITCLPSTFGKLKSLQQLYLCCDNLVGLPNSIGGLTSLQLLSVKPQCWAKLLDLPTSITGLSALSTLELHDCTCLRDVPDLTGLNLHRLDLSGCVKLQELPELGSMDSLRTLILNRTSIRSLPASVGKLAGLETLCMQKCSYLSELPPSIGRLSTLESLDLTYCKDIATLPPDAAALTQLRELVISGCPQLDVPSWLPEWADRLRVHVSHAEHPGLDTMPRLPQFISSKKGVIRTARERLQAIEV
eukprot:GHUV01006693.1.p1 GENE.GHUV01006693.1~~GHUV01006693.1.p1  ORF type:complete len:517 (+),score=92.99 GHUV01006693.1:2499-4049(+)